MYVKDVVKKQHQDICTNMKRMNRKKIITELECLRGAITHSILDAKIEEKEWKVMAYKAHYDSADKLIVELGGESCLETQNEIMRLWNEIDKNK